MFDRKIKVILFKADKTVEILKVSKKHITNNNTIKIGDNSYLYDTSKMYHSKSNAVLILHEKISNPVDLDGIINDVEIKGVTPSELNSIVDSNVVSELLSKTKSNGDENLLLLAVGLSIIVGAGAIFFAYTAVGDIASLSKTVEAMHNIVQNIPN